MLRLFIIVGGVLVAIPSGGSSLIIVNATLLAGAARAGIKATAQGAGYFGSSDFGVDLMMTGADIVTMKVGAVAGRLTMSPGAYLTGRIAARRAGGRVTFQAYKEGNGRSC